MFDHCKKRVFLPLTHHLLCSSKPEAAHVQLRTQALQLLHHFLSLPASQVQRLTQQIEDLANDIFPASSWEWKRGSSQSVDYAQQLMAIMDAMVTTAERRLSVEPILQVHQLTMKLKAPAMCWH